MVEPDVSTVVPPPFVVDPRATMLAISSRNMLDALSCRDVVGTSNGTHLENLPAHEVDGHRGAHVETRGGLGGHDRQPLGAHDRALLGRHERVVVVREVIGLLVDHLRATHTANSLE